MAQKTVLVTGASRGIGKAIATKFAKKGYNVAINCVHSEDRLLQAKKEIEGYQVPCLQIFLFAKSKKLMYTLIGGNQ